MPECTHLPPWDQEATGPFEGRTELESTSPQLCPYPSSPPVGEGQSWKPLATTSVPPMGEGERWRPPAPTFVLPPWDKNRAGGHRPHLCHTSLGGAQRWGPRGHRPPPLSLPRGRRTELEATGHHLCPSHGRRRELEAPGPHLCPPSWDKNRAGGHRPPPLSLTPGRSTEVGAKRPQAPTSVLRPPPLSIPFEGQNWSPPAPSSVPTPAPPRGRRTALEETASTSVPPPWEKDRARGPRSPPLSPPWDKNRAGGHRPPPLPSPVGEGQS